MEGPNPLREDPFQRAVQWEPIVADRRGNRLLSALSQGSGWMMIVGAVLGAARSWRVPVLALVTGPTGAGQTADPPVVDHGMPIKP